MSRALCSPKSGGVSSAVRFTTPADSSIFRKLNASPSTVEDKEVLKKMLTTPPLKRIDLAFPLGLTVTARNLRGVTIKDALDAIYKQFKKKVRLPISPSLSPSLATCLSISRSFKTILTDIPSSQADDELTDPYLKGFEWDREECYTRFIVHQMKTGERPAGESSKKKRKGSKAGDDAAGL
jgi:hypothetical protein